MSDIFSAPAVGAAAVTPHDTTANVFRSVYVGGAGNLKVTMKNGSVVTFIGVLAGAVYPFEVVLIWSTGTTATSIVGLI